ncbi:MAG: hypothetical protein JSU74_06900, partial [Candidatus Zixiibacteriota bacterium]
MDIFVGKKSRASRDSAAKLSLDCQNVRILQPRPWRGGLPGYRTIHRTALGYRNERLGQMRTSDAHKTRRKRMEGKATLHVDKDPL